MKGSYSIDPPVVISVGMGHWCSRSTSIVIEIDDGKSCNKVFPYQEFKIKMNDVVIYKGGGWGVEKFGDYVLSPNNPPEIRLIERLLQ